MKSALQGRQTHIDVLKLMASQLIVLHHFVAYGPLDRKSTRLNSSHS